MTVAGRFEGLPYKKVLTIWQFLTVLKITGKACEKREGVTVAVTNVQSTPEV